MMKTLHTLTRPRTREYFRIRREGSGEGQELVWHTTMPQSMGPLCGRDVSKLVAVHVASEFPDRMCRRCKRRLAFMELEESVYYEQYAHVGFTNKGSKDTFRTYH